MLKKNGAAMYFARHGFGKRSVIFIHGYGCSSTDWHRQVTLPIRDAELIAVDLRGHGRSGGGRSGLTIPALADDVVRFIRAIPNKEIVVVGHSMGTRIALEVARQLPDLIVGLVLLDGSCSPGDARKFREERSEEIRRLGRREFNVSILEATIVTGLSEEDRTGVFDRVDSLSDDMTISLLTAMCEWDSVSSQSTIGSIRAPTLIVQSTSILSDATGERAFANLAPDSAWLRLWRDHPYAKIELLSGVGHFCMLEDPNNVNRLLTTFCNSLSAH
jgi:pimeloyl-ACP methyl ester carboxylesterase